MEDVYQLIIIYVHIHVHINVHVNNHSDYSKYYSDFFFLKTLTEKKKPTAAKATKCMSEVPQ